MTLGAPPSTTVAEGAAPSTAGSSPLIAISRTVHLKLDLSAPAGLCVMRLHRAHGC